MVAPRPLNAALGSNGELAVQFRPLSPQAFDAVHGHSLLQAVYEALQAQIGSDTRYSAIEQLPNVPASAKVAWYVWWFIAEAGGSGIPGYLANHVGSTAEVRSFRKALDVIGAVEAVRLLDAALALEEVASSLPPDHESDWYKQFKAGDTRILFVSTCFSENGVDRILAELPDRFTGAYYYSEEAVPFADALTAAAMFYRRKQLNDPHERVLRSINGYFGKSRRLFYKSAP